MDDKSLDGFHKLVLIYTLETDFYKDLNSALAFNDIDSFGIFIRAFIYFCNQKIPTIKLFQEKVVYRGCSIWKGDNSENSRKTRLSYPIGMFYYWPSFTSTSTKLGNIIKMMKPKIKKDDCEIIFFKINLRKENRNKFDISEISAYKNEDEILLLPYFYFRVVSSSPIAIDNKNFVQIEIEELSDSDLPIQLVWFDPKIHNKENWKYRKILNESLRARPCLYFDSAQKAIEYIKSEKYLHYLVISCGSEGKGFVDKIHSNDQVIKIAVFCYNIELHSKWFNDSKYSKYSGVFNEFDQLFKSFPKFFC